MGTVATLIENWLLCIASRPNGDTGLTPDQINRQKRAEGEAEQAVADAIRSVGPVRYGRRTFLSSFPIRTSAVFVLYDENLRRAEDVPWPPEARTEASVEKVAGFRSESEFPDNH